MDSYYRRRATQQRKKTKGKFGIFVLLLAIGGLGLGIFLLASFMFSEVQIALIPSKESRTIEKKIALDYSIEEPLTDPLVLPTRLLQVEVTEITTFDIESEIDLGAKARGIVKLVNETGVPVHLGLDTVLRGPQNQEYSLTKASTLPGAKVSIQGELQFGEDLVEVVAKEAGERSNISSGRLSVSTVEASIRSKVYGQIQLSGITGGTSRIVKAVTDEEIDRGRQLLESAARDALYAKFRTQLSDDEILPEELIALEEVISSVPEKGREADEVEVRYTLKAKGYSMPKTEVLSILTAEAQAGASQDEQDAIAHRVGNISIDSIQFTESFIDDDKGRAETVLVVPIAVWGDPDNEALKQEIAGKSIPEARRILLSNEAIRDVRFVKRFWLSSKLPKNPSKIIIEISG